MTDQQPAELPEEVQELVTRLFAMAREGDLDLIEYIRQGVDPNLSNQDGNSFLMLAAYAGHAPLVRELIRVGADPDRANERGQTPIAGVIFKGEEEVLEVLLEAGADPHAGHPTAIDAAKMFGREDLLSRLQ